MPTSVIDGLKLYWEITGSSGEALVLVHGSWGDHHGWDRVVPLLAGSFRVLTYDRRGHSQSERPAGPIAVQDHVADLAGLIEVLDLAPAHVAGNSFGGSIGLRLAGQHPDLFRSLIAHEPPLFDLLAEQPETQTMLADLQRRMQGVLDLLEGGDMEAGARLFVETMTVGPGAWGRLSPEMQGTHIANAPTALQEARDPEMLRLDLASLARFTRPALLTLGELSPPFYAPVVARVAAALPRVERETFARVGHMPQLSDPRAYVQTVAEFIGKAM